MLKRRKRKKTIGKILFRLLLFAAIILACLYYSNEIVTVKEYSLSFGSLPKSFEGFRIAQLSDIHGGDKLGENGEKLISALEKEKPDIIVITGDLTDKEHTPDTVEPILKRLTELCPVYYVTGNHEWSARHINELSEMFERLGIKALRNEYIIITRGGESIALAGIDDKNGYKDRKMPEQVLSELHEENGDIFTILLSHRPDGIEDYWSYGCNLVFSGHLHGGVVRLPIVGGVFASAHSYFPKYTKGVYYSESGNEALVESAGLTGYPNYTRLFNPMHVPIAVLHCG